MRVLFLCASGDGMLDLALRAQALGHKCRMHLKTFDPIKRPIGKGLVEHVGDWRAAIDWADLTILESNGLWMSEMDAWRQRGALIVGGNAESAKWELDREKGMGVFKKCGIPVPPFRVFNDYAEAISFVERKGEAFYSKPCSDTADKSLSAKTGVPEEPAWMLRKWKKKHGRPPCPFLLQESIKGIEFAVGAWFGPAGFADGWEENFEHKKLHAGDLGPNCGEAGTIMRYVRHSTLAQMCLAPLEESLARLGYTGNVDVNCIVDEDGHPWPLEFTMRCGWPAFNIELDLIEWDDPIEFLMALARGESTKGAHKFDTVACGVVLALPPYPYPPRDYEDLVGVPLWLGGQEAKVQGRENDDDKEPEIEIMAHGWHPCEMMAGTLSPLASAGGYVGVAVGTGDTVRQAQRGAYRLLKKISMPATPHYRIDIGSKLKKELPELQRHGFAQRLEY